MCAAYSLSFALLFTLFVVGAHTADQLSEFTITNFTGAPITGVASTVLNGQLIMSQPGSSLTGTTAWYNIAMQVRGFQCKFTYQISNNTKLPNQRPDGIAFVIQTSTVEAQGAAGAGLGYGQSNAGNSGIPNSVAIEFDSWYNPDLLDPPMFHISIHSRGNLSNSASEQYRIGSTFNNSLYDLDVQQVTVRYDPVVNGGTMTVFFNDQSELSVPNLSLDALAGLDEEAGTAFIGFTAGSHSSGTTAFVETISVSEWTFQFLGLINAANTLVAFNDSVVAGEGLSVSVRAVDQYNYPMIIDGVGDSGYILSATLTESNGNVLNSSASYSGSGKYVLQFNTTTSGAAVVRVYLNTTLVGAGSYPLTVISAPPFAPLSYPFGFTSGVSTPAVAGVIGSFFVQPVDEFGNNITVYAGNIVEATITSLSNASYSLHFPGVYSPDAQCYFVSYNVTLADNFTLQVTVGGAATKDSVQSLQVLPAAVDPETCILYGVNNTAVAGEIQYAYVQLKDVFGNNAADASATIEIKVSQGNATNFNGTVQSCTDSGLCQILYNLTVASYSSYYNVHVLVDGLPVQNSFVTTVKVIPAALSPATSYVYGDGAASGVAGEFAYFFVQLTDAFGNNNSYPSAQVSPSLTTANGPAEAPTPYGGPDGGLYIFQYNLTLATTYTLQIEVESQPISNSVNTITISPNVVFPPNCVGFGTGISGDVVVGDLNSFYVQLRDEFQNNITASGAEALVVVIESSTLQLNATTVFNNGLYEVSYNLTEASDYNITITINDIPIFNSAEQVTLVPAEIFPLQCVATSVATAVTAGALNEFYIQLCDVYSNNITNVPNPDGIVTASFVPLLNGTNVDITVAYAGSGIYTLSYNVTLVAGYTLSVAVNQSAIKGGGQFVVQVDAAAAYPPLCYATGAGLKDAVAGVTATFQVFLFDVYQNQIIHPTSDDQPTIDISGQNFTLDFDASLPAYSITFNVTAAGQYTVTVSVAGTQLTSSALTVAPAPLYVSNCLASGDSLAGATAGDAGVFTIQLRDQFGNAILDYTQVTAINITMLQQNGTQVYPLTPTTTGNGIYTVNYNATVAATYSMEITINGVDVLGSPFATQIAAAPFDPHGTVTSGLATSLVAGSLNTFTIILKDIWGNNVTDSSVPNPVIPGEISVKFNSTPILIDVTAPTDGLFLVQYTITVAGPYFMTVTINDTDVGSSPPGDVVVHPSYVYAPLCLAVGDATSEAIVKQSNTFTLIVKDMYNNTRMWSPTAPTVTLAATGLALLYGSAANQTDGSYLVSYFISEKTTYTLSVLFDGQHIKGSPFTVSSNYGNNSPSTVLIVCLVVGGVVLIAAIVGGVYWYRRRRTPYVALLE